MNRVRVPGSCDQWHAAYCKYHINDVRVDWPPYLVRVTNASAATTGPTIAVLHGNLNSNTVLPASSTSKLLAEYFHHDMAFLSSPWTLPDSHKYTDDYDTCC